MDNSSSNKSGFTITSSGDALGFPSYHPFNTWKTHWIPSDKNNAWIQIECPEAVRIYKFGLRGKIIGGLLERIKSFTLLGRQYGNIDNWIVLNNSINTPIGTLTQFFDVNNLTTFKFFKLQINGSDGEAPGLSHFQLFTLDSLKMV